MSRGIKHRRELSGYRCTLECKIPHPKSARENAFPDPETEEERRKNIAYQPKINEEKRTEDNPDARDFRTGIQFHSSSLF